MEREGSDVERDSHESCEEYPLPEVTVNSNKRFKFSITIEPIVFSLFLTDTLSDLVLPNFILMRTCSIHFQFNQSVCSELAHPERNLTGLVEEVQPYAALILTGMNFLSKLLPAFFSLFLGPWSDYNGRKLILVLPTLGYLMQHLLMIGYGFFTKLAPEYGLLVVMPVALTGGFTNFITGVYSYTSDISREDNRSFRMSVIESVMYSSIYIGLLSSSYILKAGGSYGFILLYSLNAFLLLLTLVPTYFFVPESVQTTEFGRGLLKIFDFELIREMFHVCFKKRENNKRAVIFLVIATLTISLGVMTGESNVLYLYTKLQFEWDIHEFSIWASIILASSFIGLLLGSAAFTKFLNMPDAILGIISYTLKSASAFYLSFIPSTAPNLMYYNGFLAFFNGLSGPIGRAILSKIVSKEELGKVFALLGAAEAIFPLAIGPIFTILYNFTIATLPSAFLFVSGSSFVLCTVFYIIIYILQKRHCEVEFERLNNQNINE